MLCFLVSTLFVFLLSLMLGLTSLRCWDLYIARAGPRSALVLCIAPSVPQPVFTITEKAPTRHYAKRTLTPRRVLDMKLGRRCNYNKGRAAIRHYAANKPPVPYDFCIGDPISRLLTVGSMPVEHSVLIVS